MNHKQVTAHTVWHRYRIIFTLESEQDCATVEAWAKALVRPHSGYSVHYYRDGRLYQSPKLEKGGYTAAFLPQREEAPLTLEAAVKRERELSHERLETYYNSAQWAVDRQDEELLRETQARRAEAARRFMFESHMKYTDPTCACPIHKRHGAPS